MAMPAHEIRHFLDLDRIAPSVLRQIVDEAGVMKRKGADGVAQILAGRHIGLIFEKPSTRTRLSFEVGIARLGGRAAILSPADMQLGRGETVADTARVLSRYLDAIMIRTKDHARLEELAAHATVPVINGLTDRSHPCQLLADIMTIEEHCGPADSCVVAWSGDGNNVTTSLIHAAAAFGFELRLACPPAMAPSPMIVEAARERGARIMVTGDPVAAVRDAHCVMTDTWVSMGNETAEVASRQSMLQPWQVNTQLMAHARADAVFMHCLPAWRGAEVSADVIDGPQSVVWDQAENRMYAQMAILAWCIGGGMNLLG